MSGMSFFSDDRDLCRGFEWAKREALLHVAGEGAAGPCYEAALPGRAAYCMRDTAHQALGAQLLGLADSNYYMLNQFAKGVDERRDFCSYWEICYDGTPCPVDYDDDSSFWYNLPANFDVLDACLRMYRWTGDTRYLNDPDMDAFYRITTHDYVRRWDRDRDGIVDRLESDGRRGLATYDESPRNPGYRIAADLLALQYAAFRARGDILCLRGEPEAAQLMTQRAQELQRFFHEKWWNADAGHYESIAYPDGTTGGEFIGSDAHMPLYTGMIQDPQRKLAQAKYLYSMENTMNVELRSYMSEVLWDVQMDEAALAIWRRSTAPGYARREYPEVSFAAIGSLVSGYMGLRPDAATRTLSTRSALLGGGWAEAVAVPLWGGEVSLLHKGRHASVLENRTGGPILWTATFEAGAPQTAQVPAGEAVALGAD